MGWADSKRSVRIYFLVYVVFALVVLGLIWAGVGDVTNSSGESVELTLSLKLLFTFGALIAGVLGWIFIKYQDKKDEGAIHGSKIMAAGFKVGGWSLRVKAIRWFMAAGSSIILGLIIGIFVMISWNVLFGIVCILIGFAGGVANYFLGKWYWDRSKSLVQGRVYAEE